MTFGDPAAVLRALRSGFQGRHILVVGDLMLDRYLWGRVDRISPEAPVPVVHLERKTETAGGAANVARNLAALGLRVSLGGVTGNDDGRRRLLADLTPQGVDVAAVLAAESRITTVKTRVVGNHQQMIRIDEEHALPLSAADAESLLDRVRTLLPSAHALVISDYAKGVVTTGLCRSLIADARAAAIPILVDPKGRDFSRYADATLITPNRAELALVTGVAASDLDALTAAAAALRSTLRLDYLVQTLGEHGMALVGADGIRQIPAVAREVFDVSGAGDTVIAAVAAGLVAGLHIVDCAHLGNLAAGLVVAKIGTATVTATELLAAIAEAASPDQPGYDRSARASIAEPQTNKICDLLAITERVRRWRAAGERVVFTNGCFDLLHAGHVTYLEQARRYGNRLVVGLNSDRSVRALKGPNRPLVQQADRARVLAALAAVDALVLFDQDTPLDLIVALRPDVLVKGADYREDQVVGAEHVKSWGGRLVLVPLVAKQSSSAIIARMRLPGCTAADSPPNEAPEPL